MFAASLGYVMNPCLKHLIYSLLHSSLLSIGATLQVPRGLSGGPWYSNADRTGAAFAPTGHVSRSACIPSYYYEIRKFLS